MCMHTKMFTGICLRLSSCLLLRLLVITLAFPAVSPRTQSATYTSMASATMPETYSRHPRLLPLPMPWREVGPTLMRKAGKEAMQLRHIVVAAATDLVAKKPVRWDKAVKLLVTASACAATCRTFGAAWVAQKAGEKFRSKAGLYLTIPVIAGVLNWATNKLAVWMIFNPESFCGVGQRPGEPLGWFGWQGIVPAKVRKMGSDIVDMTIHELLDVKKVFGRLEPRHISHLMSQRGLLTALADAAEETSTLPANLIAEARNRDQEGQDTLVGQLLERQACRVVSKVVGMVRKDPLRYCPLKKSVVDDMATHRKLICELFQRCGRDELRFIVDVGLWGGAFLGLAQMAVWLVFTPKWSLVAGGALVGYATDWAALKVMFEPVEPWKPRWLAGPISTLQGREWKGFQGLFLTRQDAVSEEFSTFMSEKILTPQKIWAALLAPNTSVPSCEEERRFEELLVRELEAEAGLFIKGGRSGVVKLARALRPRLIPVVEGTCAYVKEKMRLEQELVHAMRKMNSARFEKVLHPIFQEDELTLIVVGAVLGGLAGYGQTFFY